MAGGTPTPQQVQWFQQAGQQFHINPADLAGIASVESNFGANKGPSSAGAVGTMQFLPSTAQGLGINPNNDKQAIFGAAKLLNQYGYQQDRMRALGAYNGGPGNPQSSYANMVASESHRLSGLLSGVNVKGILPNSTNVLNGTKFTNSTTISGGQTDYKDALLQYLMKPTIDLSGKINLNSNLLGAVNSAQTTPATAITHVSASNGIAQQHITAMAVNTARASGANPDAQKLLGMIHQVIGGTYNQGNHADINESAAQIRAQGTDCSGFVSWLMGPHGLGLWSTSLATPDIANAPGMHAGRGSIITVWNNKQPGNSGHVFIQVGNQFYASEGGVGIHQVSTAEAQNYITHGSDGGTYQPLHPQGL